MNKEYFTERLKEAAEEGWEKALATYEDDIAEGVGEATELNSKEAEIQDDRIFDMIYSTTEEEQEWGYRQEKNFEKAQIVSYLRFLKKRAFKKDEDTTLVNESLEGYLWVVNKAIATIIDSMEDDD